MRNLPAVVVFISLGKNEMVDFQSTWAIIGAETFMHMFFFFFTCIKKKSNCSPFSDINGYIRHNWPIQ